MSDWRTFLVPSSGVAIEGETVSDSVDVEVVDRVVDGSTADGDGPMSQVYPATAPLGLALGDSHVIPADWH